MNLISLKDWETEQFVKVIEFALAYKHDWQKWLGTLQGKTLLMLFEKTSTRTRVSFESGFSKMGGHAIYLDTKVSNLGLSELKDEVRYLTRNVDIIMARLLRNADMLTIAEHSTVPVINGCCELHHPCQALTDLMTIKEVFGTWNGLSATYVGMRNNVSNELISGMTRVGMRLYLVTPLDSPDKVVPAIDEQAMRTGNLVVTTDLREAVRNSDVVYTDTWVDMEFFGSPDRKEQNEQRIRSMMPYQVNGELLSVRPGIKVMHDMPMHPGYEISRDAIENEGAIIFQQAENRMWAQNALMLKMLGVY